MFFLAPKELALIPDFKYLSQSALYYQYNEINKHFGKGKGSGLVFRSLCSMLECQRGKSKIREPFPLRCLGGMIFEKCYHTTRKAIIEKNCNRKAKMSKS